MLRDLSLKRRRAWRWAHYWYICRLIVCRRFDRRPEHGSGQNDQCRPRRRELCGIYSWWLFAPTCVSPILFHYTYLVLAPLLTWRAIVRAPATKSVKERLFLEFLPEEEIIDNLRNKCFVRDRVFDADEAEARSKKARWQPQRWWGESSTKGWFSEISLFESCSHHPTFYEVLASWRKDYGNVLKTHVDSHTFPRLQPARVYIHRKSDYQLLCYMPRLLGWLSLCCYYSRMSQRSSCFAS